MLEALIFDVDGTVAETEGLHRRAFNLAFERHGIDIRWDEREYRRLLRVHGGKERIARSLAEHEEPRPPAEIAAIHATKTRIYDELLHAEGVPWRPGVRRLMTEAKRAGLRLALATTTSEANLEPLFAPVLGEGWRTRFEAIVAGDAVPRKKPAPDVYLEALRRLDLDASQAVAFEDSRAGVEAARAAGLAVVGVPSRWLAGDDLSTADLVLEHFGDAGELWEASHPTLARRWLSARSLIAWHARRATEAPDRKPRARRTRCPPPA
ncbi:MAG TPA: HAD-IA family hydrolase [Usitatibacter sp.]|nr:HAD-IA family hydrolase [Usitatibacter sp.]